MTSERRVRAVDVQSPRWHAKPLLILLRRPRAPGSPRYGLRALPLTHRGLNDSSCLEVFQPEDLVLQVRHRKERHLGHDWREQWPDVLWFKRVQPGFTSTRNYRQSYVTNNCLLAYGQQIFMWTPDQWTNLEASLITILCSCRAGALFLPKLNSIWKPCYLKGTINVCLNWFKFHGRKVFMESNALQHTVQCSHGFCSNSKFN